MKKIIISTLLLAGLISCSSDQNVAKSKNNAETETTSVENGINLKDSKVVWSGSKITGGKHSGEVSFKSGNLTWKDGKISKGTFTVDMNSITCNDIKDPESNKDLVDHLKSDDFFAVNQFPLTVVEILEVQTSETGQEMAAVSLEIRGVKKVVPANISMAEKNGEKTLLGRLEINRTDFGVVYNSSNFFKSLGDKVIDDMVRLKFAVKLK